MGATSITQVTERISQLLGTRYDVSGDLATRANKVRKRLPKKVNAALDILISAELMAHNPKLAAQIDTEAVAEAYDLALKHLKGVGRAERRKGTVLGITASIAFSLLVVGVGLIAVLRWRGYL